MGARLMHAKQKDPVCVVLARNEAKRVLAQEEAKAAKT
jgi:hypothetical protein